MKLNNKGFTLIEGLLVVIALSLIAGISYYVYDKQSSKDDKATVATSERTGELNDEAPAKQIPDGWTEYKDDAKGFSFGYPSQWGEIKVTKPDFKYEGENYVVSFTKSEVKGTIASEDFKFTDDGRDAAFWEVQSGSYDTVTNEMLDSAEKAKTSDSYSSILVGMGNNYTIDAYFNCLENGILMNMVAQLYAKKNYILSLSNSEQTQNCEGKVNEDQLDKALVETFKAIPNTIRTF